MSKKLNQHVMTAKFREGLRDVYISALADAGIDLDEEQVKPHMWGTADIELSEGQLSVLREHYESDLDELSAHRNSGWIEIGLPAGLDYLENNRPTLTDEERAAKESRGTGVNREEAEKRRKAKQALRRRLAEKYGIDLDNEDTE
jgi:hypothetical protein